MNLILFGVIQVYVSKILSIDLVMTFCLNSKDKEKTIPRIVCNVYYNFSEQHINFNFIEIFGLHGKANCFDVFIPFMVVRLKL